MKKQISLTIRSVMALISLTGSIAFASDELPNQHSESYISGLLGTTVVTSSGGGNSFTYNGRIGTTLFAMPDGLLSAGLVVGNTSNTANLGTITASGGTTLIGAELISRREFGTGLYLGARFGIGLQNITLSQSGSSISGSGTTFMVGPVAGYEFPIANGIINLDLDVSWLTASGSTVTFPGVGEIHTNSVSAFLFQGGIVYHW